MITTTMKKNQLIAKFISERTGKKIKTPSNKMNYHTNWNSLMSVRDEVQKLGVEVAVVKGCTVTDLEGNTAFIESTDDKSDRLATWEALVNFITDYYSKPATPAEKITQELQA